jgi:hypothetical protein
MSYLLVQASSQYLRPADNAAYTLTSPAMSFACWLKMTSLSAYQAIIGQASTAWLYRVEGVANKLGAETPSASKASASALTSGTWTHVAFTSDGSGNWAWYINGASDASGSGYIWSSPDATCYVGQTGGGQFLDARIAYLAIWSTGLTSGNITTLQSSTTPESVGSGCVASWHMNTETLDDFSATNNPLVATGAVFDADNPTLGPGPSSFSKPLWPMSYF